MLRVTIELDHAVTRETKTLAELAIWNTASGTFERGNYKIVGSVLENDEVHRPVAGFVRDFDRLNRNSLELLYEVLKSMFEVSEEDEEDESIREMWGIDE